MQELETSRIPVGEVLKAKDVMNDRHIKEQKVYKDMQYPELDKTVPVVGPAIELSDNPGEIRTRAPLLGEHNIQILHDLGYSDDEIVEFKTNRII
jgi:crotonobetainyl-CoA:carnitine CoA-transferase CaiB-like acyl-CoA transferase